MTENVKTILIVGGVALVGYLLYKKFTGVSSTTKPTSLRGPGVGQSGQPGTTSGTGDFWSSLGNVGQGLNSATSAVESTYNNIYDLFGGAPSTTGTGQGNNGTAG